jgi:alkanesulfonate monooxygenase SsuD/methylene tetrahydromethanopterin reductase-like flavin-dependent oxidoreductase (luciferase family)
VAALDRISIVAIGETAADLAEQAKAAEAAGIDCVWTPELFRSSVTQATWLAARTEKVGVGTGIAWAFTRSAFILAVTALDIDEMSGGRFRLGLGAGVKRLNETWHSVDYGKPAPHLRETIEAARLIMEKAARRTIAFYSTVRTYKPLWEMHGFGDTAAAAGDAFRRGDLAVFPEQIPDEMVDAYTAAGPLDKVRERVAEAAERGDGVWLTPATYFIPPEQIGEYQQRIIEAFAPASRAGSSDT